MEYKTYLYKLKTLNFQIKRFFKDKYIYTYNFIYKVTKFCLFYVQCMHSISKTLLLKQLIYLVNSSISDNMIALLTLTFDKIILCRYISDRGKAQNRKK